MTPHIVAIGISIGTVLPLAAHAQEPYGFPDHGLQCAAIVPSSALREATVARLSDLEIDLWLENTTGETLRVVMDEPSSTNWALPELFDVAIAPTDGRKVSIPEFDYQCGWVIDEMCTVRELAAGHRLERHVKLADWFGPQGFDLPPGEYRLEVTYIGLRSHDDWAPTPELKTALARQYKPFEGAWKGKATSRPIAVTISPPSEKLEWSEPQKGLRAALELRPSTGPLVFGESVQPIVHLENAGEDAITFDVELPVDQDDDIEVKDADGRSLQASHGYCTGASPEISWVLRPGERIAIFGAPIELRPPGPDRTRAWPRRIEAPPGTYALSYRLLLRQDGGWTFHTPPKARAYFGDVVAGPRTFRLAERR
jgi:hypothetical protein